MLSMKRAVPTEIAAIKKRTTRSLAMERITPKDHDYIVKRLDEIVARVVEMPEYPEKEH